MRYFFITLLAGLIYVSPAVANQAAKTKSLHAFNDVFNQAVIDRDADTLVGLYSHDTLWIEQGKKPVTGLEEPRKLFEFVTSNQGDVSHTVDNLFLSSDGSMAVMIGSVQATVEKVGMDATGTYLFVLKPEGDSWKIVTDMWHQHDK